MWILHGNVNEPDDTGCSPGKSSLFFLTLQYPEIGLSGARVTRVVERGTSAASGLLQTVLEKSGEGIVFTPGRTHNRSRSPR